MLAPNSIGVVKALSQNFRDRVTRDHSNPMCRLFLK